jgi:hypothetical protein
MSVGSWTFEAGDSMRREDIATGCAMNPYHRTRVPVTIEPGLDDRLLVVVEPERFGHTPPERPVASCLASYENGGKASG